jgi:hypothetical protein
MSTPPPEKSFARARTIAIALAAATIGYAIVGTALVLAGIIPKGGLSELPSQTALIVKTALLLAGLGATAASFVIRRMREAQVPAGDAGIQQRMANMIVAMAMAESAGVMGFAVALITADPLFSLLLWGIAIAGCIAHFPTRAAFGVN